MYVKFMDNVPGTKVHFAVGRSYARAKGEIIDNPTNKLLRVGFPNSLYLTIEHAVNADGQFTFDFWYKDQASELAVEKIDGYSLTSEEIILAKEADLTWVYIMGGFMGLFLLFILILVFCRMRR